MAGVRSVPEDFRVDEIPLYLPTGTGDHTFIRVEKRLRTTEDVVRSLARIAGARARDVGYAGRKDRVAVATQWFSVPRLDPARARDIALPGIKVLEAARHPHKLRTGQLRGNRFRIVVRDLDEQARASVRRRLERSCRLGMPNRFGAQRFGHGGENVQRAQRLLLGQGAAADRRAARFLISALQAAVFNAALAARETPLDQLEQGDVAMVHASGGCFVVEDLAREAPRAAAFEISATGPIFGTRVLEPRGAAAEREREALERFGVVPGNLRPPGGIKLRGSRRSLRVKPEEARASRIDGGLELCFSLPPGSYATVLLDELLSSETGCSQRDT